MSDSPQVPDEPTLVDLRNRLADLESANAELTAKLHAGAVGTTTARPVRWRGVVATVLIVLGAVLTPVSIVSGWARVLLSDTDGFVATYSPLSDHPQVQDYLTDKILEAVDARIDIDTTVGEVFDGLGEVLQRPGARLALEALRQPAADGVRATIRGVAAEVVESESFTEVWRESLRLSHGEAIGALSGSADSSLAISEGGLGLRLGPLIAEVKAVLAEQGFAFADRIPVIDRTVVLVESDELDQAMLAYRAALASGQWLGIVVLVLLAGGVWASSRRWLATIGAAVGVGLGAALVLGAISVAREVVPANVPAAVMPDHIVVIFYDTVSAAIKDLATASLLLAVVVALVGWLAAPLRVSRAVRGAWAGFTGGLRSRADSYGLSTGRLGRWLHGQRVLVRVVVGALATVVLAFNRPLTAGIVIGTALTALLVLVVLSVLERPSEPVIEPSTGVVED